MSRHIDVRLRFSGLLVLITMWHFLGCHATVSPPWWSTHTLPLSTQPHSACIAQFEWFGAVQGTTPWADIYSPHCGLIVAQDHDHACWQGNDSLDHTSRLWVLGHRWHAPINKVFDQQTAVRERCLTQWYSSHHHRALGG